MHMMETLYNILKDWQTMELFIIGLILYRYHALSKLRKTIYVICARASKESCSEYKEHKKQIVNQIENLISDNALLPMETKWLLASGINDITDCINELYVNSSCSQTPDEIKTLHVHNKSLYALEIADKYTMDLQWLGIPMIYKSIKNCNITGSYKSVRKNNLNLT